MFVFLTFPAGIEYIQVSTDVTLNAGISTQMVTIPILDNTIVADSTSFNVILMTTDPAVVLNPTTADVTIEDEDSE